MTEEATKYLYDILQAIELIEDFTKDYLSFFDYQKDIKTKSAVERQVGIIGEAVNKFQKIEEGYKLTNAHQMVAVRNRIIHSYDTIDDAIIWAIIKRHLNVLKLEIHKGLEL